MITALPWFSFDPLNLVAMLIVTIAVQAFCFAFAAFFKTDRLTDFAYGMTFVLIAVLLYVAGPAPDLRSGLMLLGVVLWGLRLAIYLFVRIHKMGRDVRFDGRREDFWSFAAFWSLQAAAIWLIMLPTIVVSSDSTRLTLGPVGYAGLGLFAFGLLYETIADWQKFSFRNNPQNKGRWIEAGLWKHSRYPNYFGEIALWWGLFIAALPVLSGWTYASVIGPIFITVLLLKVSGIPLLEESQERKYGQDPAYQTYRETTSLLIPWPRRSN